MSILMLLPGIVSLTISYQNLGGGVLELSHKAARFLNLKRKAFAMVTLTALRPC